MKKNIYARLENNIVVEIIKLDGGVDVSQIYHPDIAKNIIVCDETIKEGLIYNGKTFEAPIIEEQTSSTKVLQPLTARQFWQAALSIGVTEEGLASDISNPENPMYVANDEERESVLIDIKKTTQFSRDHYLIEDLTKAKNIPTEQLDSLWQWASQIQ